MFKPLSAFVMGSLMAMSAESLHLETPKHDQQWPQEYELIFSLPVYGKYECVEKHLHQGVDPCFKDASTWFARSCSRCRYYCCRGAQWDPIRSTYVKIQEPAMCPRKTLCNSKYPADEDTAWAYDNVIQLYNSPVTDP